MSVGLDSGGLRGDFLGIGLTGIVVRCRDKALKSCRRYNATNVPEARRLELEYLMEISRDKLKTELEVYKHLGEHDGIIPVYNKDDLAKCDDDTIEPVIEMRYMKNGSLQSYLAKERPDARRQIIWARSLAATIAFCHDRHVIVADICSRNCLLGDDLSLVLCDFGESTIIPPHLDMNDVNDYGASVKTDIAQFGLSVYEIATGINLSDPRLPSLRFVEDELNSTSHDDAEEGDCIDENQRCGSDGSIASYSDRESEWPPIEDLPDTQNVRFGTIIRKCWTRKYQNMQEVCDDLSRDPATGFSLVKHWAGILIGQWLKKLAWFAMVVRRSIGGVIGLLKSTVFESFR